jgi:hypothetical protein
MSLANNRLYFGTAELCARLFVEVQANRPGSKIPYTWVLHSECISLIARIRTWTDNHSIAEVHSRHGSNKSLRKQRIYTVGQQHSELNLIMLCGVNGLALYDGATGI